MVQYIENKANITSVTKSINVERGAVFRFELLCVVSLKAARVKAWMLYRRRMITYPVSTVYSAVLESQLTILW